jgi:conjugative transfer region protein TrbK
MDTKLFARIGAGAFVAIALTMSLLQLREGPKATLPETITVWEPDGDPLPAQLRACSAMGELALSSPDCRAAWAEKRRRFLGVEADESEPTRGPALDLSVAPPPSSQAQPAKGL